MRKLFIVLFLLVVSMTIFAQVADTTATDPTAVNTALDWVKSNMWTMIILVYAIISELLPETSKIKANSVFRLIWGFIGKFLQKKAPGVVPTVKKGGTGKIILLAVILSSMASYTAFSQSKWDGFFKPVTNKVIITPRNFGVETTMDEWKFRPAVTITAVQFVYNKETKKFDSSSLTSGGIGVSYAHYTTVNGIPYNNVGVNFIALLNFTPTETTTTGIGFATTVTAFEYFNMGAGYDFTNKNFMILAGVKLGFN